MGVASEPSLRAEIAALERGEVYDPEKAPEVPETFSPQENRIELPTDPAEVEKRVKNLKKKIQQIETLKEKGGVLDADAKAKIASHRKLVQEVAALERGDSEVVFDELVEAQKRMKAIKKKLDAIAKLKESNNLDADGQAKLANEKALKKELHEVEKEIGEMNKKERDRVAQRLGWEVEENKKKKKNK